MCKEIFAMRLFSAILMLTIMTFLIEGCSLSAGGMPHQSFDIENDLQQLEKRLAKYATIDAYYDVAERQGATDEDRKVARNRFIAARLVTTNINYFQFVRSMTSDKQLLDTATDILVLSMNLAGAAISSSTAKTVLHAISAGVTGAKISIDKNYYYEKTVPALVAAMNAQRVTALLPVLQGTKLSINEYTFEQAVSDIDAYYYAGTLQMAINTIQADAATKQQKAQESIDKLVPLSEQDVATKEQCSRTIHGLKDSDPANIQKMRQVLDLLHVSDAYTMKEQTVKKTLIRYIKIHTDTPAEIRDVADAISAAGIELIDIVEPTPTTRTDSPGTSTSQPSTNPASNPTTISYY
jgi:hypothetical protein